MNRIHKHRLFYIGLSAIGLTLATSLILFALKQNINVFLTPHQLSSQRLPTDYHFRLGGMVKNGSLVRGKESLQVQFIVTDYKNEVRVNYLGVLPDLFREGKGVVAEGHINAKGIFVADSVLAKHDENYMPKNVYKALRNATGEQAKA